MKRIPIVLLLVVFVVRLSAQEAKAWNLPAFDQKRLHFGFTVGFNAMDLAIQRNYDNYNPTNPEDGNFIYSDVTTILPGFQVGAVSDLRLNDNWNLRFLPGISFGSRDLYFYYYSGDGEGEEADGPWRNPATLGPAFLDFPLQFKYRAHRHNNARPYLIGGANFRYDMATKKEFDRESNEYIKLKPGGFYLEFGFGVDTYLRYFKFAPEIKLAIGLNNMLSDDVHDTFPMFVESIDRVTSYIVMLNFHFE
jgi:hypothetical protein